MTFMRSFRSGVRKLSALREYAEQHFVTTLHDDSMPAWQIAGGAGTHRTNRSVPPLDPTRSHMVPDGLIC